jgi:hypothetical protein
MNTSIAGRVSGIAFVLAGLTWVSGMPIMAALSDGDPVKTAAEVAVTLGSPSLLTIGFCSMWLYARRLSRPNGLQLAAYAAPVLASVALVGTSLNELAHDSDPAWLALMWSVCAFIAAAGIAGGVIAASRVLPRWSAVALTIVSSLTVACFILAMTDGNAIAVPPVLALVLFMAFGAGLVVLGGGTFAPHREPVRSPAPRPSPAL